MPQADTNRPPAVPALQCPGSPHARVIKKKNRQHPLAKAPPQGRDGLLFPRIRGEHSNPILLLWVTPACAGSTRIPPIYYGSSPRDCGERLRTWYHRKAACRGACLMRHRIAHGRKLIKWCPTAASFRKQGSQPWTARKPSART